MVREFNEGRERTSLIARRRSNGSGIDAATVPGGDRGGAPLEPTQLNIAGNTGSARSDLSPKRSRRALADNRRRIAGSYCKGFSPIDQPH
jgi:hypothetical protein